MSTRYGVIVGVLWLVGIGPAMAQPALTVEPDTLFYDSETEITLRNTGTEVLQVDQLSTTAHQPQVWELRVAAPAATFELLLPTIEPIVGFTLAPGDAATISIEGYDPCIACKAAGWTGADQVVDTLSIRALRIGIDDTLTQTVRLDISALVSAEAPPGLREGLRVYPNPFVDEVRVELPASASGTWRIEVYNLLGQRVAEREVRPAGGDVSRLRLPDHAAPGLYVFYVYDGTHRLATQRLVKLPRR